MEPLEHGIVAYTEPAKNRPYSAEVYLSDESGRFPTDALERKRLHLPLNRGRYPRLAEYGQSVTFASSDSMTAPERSSLVHPEPGTHVRFHRDQTPFGSSKIDWWTLHEPLLKLEDKLKQRKCYRLLIDGIQVWEGTDIREVSTLYPKWADDVFDTLSVACTDALSQLDYCFEVFKRKRRHSGYIKAHDPRLFVCCLDRAYVKHLLDERQRPPYPIGTCTHHLVTTD